MTSWHPSAGLIRATTIAVGALSSALALHRLDLAVLGIPFLAWALRGAFNRPRGPIEARARTEGRSIIVDVDAEPTALARIAWPAVSQARRVGPSLSLDPLGVPHRTSYELLAYGRLDVPGVGVDLMDAAGDWRAHLTTPAPAPLMLSPLVARPRETVRLPHPSGGDGAHRSASPGRGVELVALRDYAPGDERRHVNWRASARRSTLQTNVFARERATDVVVVADAAWNVRGTTTSSVSLTLEAAVALTGAFVEQGDTVAFADLSGRLPSVHPGAGRRQLARVLRAVQLLTPTPDSRHRTHGAIPNASLVLLCSPLLDDAAVAFVGERTSRGARVVVLDTLPPGFGEAHDPDDDAGRLAHRLRRALRQPVVDAMTAHGIPVLRWDAGVVPLLTKAMRGGER